jgi:hypothetical protein
MVAADPHMGVEDGAFRRELDNDHANEKKG